jgi:hypothetical protein
MEEIEEDEFDINKVEKRSWEETMEEWDKKWAKKHPIANWINEVLFRGKSIGRYSPHYALGSFILLKDALYEIKWSLQRLFRGYDDQVIFSIDYYLDDMLPIWLEELMKCKQGCPMMMFQDGDFEEDGYTMKDGVMDVRVKEYDAILQKIADGFRMHRKIDDLEFKFGSPEEKAAQLQFDEAFDLFHKFYSSLWD